MKKLDEEIGEFKEAMEKNNEDAIEEELGDVLFMLVNISRFIGVNPEDALGKTISKFISRFRYIEMAAADSGRTLSDMTLAEMDALWDEEKKNECLSQMVYYGVCPAWLINRLITNIAPGYYSGVVENKKIRMMKGCGAFS
jgi:hypothetical protein